MRFDRIFIKKEKIKLVMVTNTRRNRLGRKKDPEPTKHKENKLQAQIKKHKKLPLTENALPILLD